MGFHMVQSYLPTILIVVISWVSFWMDVDSVAGRTTLGVTTLLTVSSKASGKLSFSCTLIWLQWFCEPCGLPYHWFLWWYTHEYLSPISDVQAEVPLVSYVKVSIVMHFWSILSFTYWVHYRKCTTLSDPDLWAFL